MKQSVRIARLDFARPITGIAVAQSPVGDERGNLSIADADRASRRGAGISVAGTRTADFQE